MQHNIISNEVKMGNIKKKDKMILTLLFVCAVISISLFLFYGLNANNYQYNLSKRIPKVIAIILTGITISISSMLFQTVTNNRILTPSILGLDSLYNFGQTLCIFVFGIESIMMTNKQVNFFASLAIMMIGTLILYNAVFKKGNNIFTLLLVGTVVGTLFRSLSSYMSVLIDPSDFLVLQSKMYASFNNVNSDILIIAIILVIAIILLNIKDFKKLDVLLLGRENAINLGVNADKLTKKMLLITAVLVSIATALIGPITFLGLIVVNLSYHMFNTYKHKVLMIGAALISVTALVFGQFIVERILNFSTTVSIIINFIGGIYFIYLLIKEAK